MSKAEYKEFTFNWKIKNFNFCFKKLGEYIESPEFTAENLSGTRWRLKFYPKGVLETLKTHSACYLYRSAIDSHESEIAVKFCLQIISSDGECWGLRQSNKHAFKQGGGLGIYKFDIADMSNKMLKCSNKSITIRCQIQSQEIDCEPAIGCDATTDFNLEVSSFLCHVDVENISNFTKTKNFTLPNTSEFEIDLSIFDDKLFIYIYKLNETYFSQLVYLDVHLLDIKGDKIKSKSESHLFEDTNPDGWKIHFLSKNELNTDSRKLLFEFRSSKSYSSDIENYIYANASGSATLTYLEVLQEDLHALYTDKKFPDVEIKVANETFPTHKAILAARSPVFCAMFNQDMLENKTSNVCISDTDPVTMSSFLTFLYTGTLDNVDYETALKLLLLADKYEVPSLKEKCASCLISIIAVENIFEILYTADLVQHTLLKTSAIDYIIAQAAIVLPSPEWGKWIESNLKLATEVFSKISLKFVSKKI